MTDSEASPIEVFSQGRAAVYEEPSGPSGVRVRELPRTRPRPGHVEVQIKTASINHLDLWLAHGAQRITPPRVTGAHGAGLITPSTDPRWHEGGPAAVFPTPACGEC